MRSAGWCHRILRVTTARYELGPARGFVLRARAGNLKCRFGLSEIVLDGAIDTGLLRFVSRLCLRDVSRSSAAPGCHARA